MDSTLQVGKKLVQFCREGKFLEAAQTLYSPNIASIEVRGDEKMPARVQGLPAVLDKAKWWTANHEVHGCEVGGPWPHGDRFIVTFKMDVTPKSGPMAGKRLTFEEAGLYAVKDGKVAQEEFFYDMGG